MATRYTVSAQRQLKAQGCSVTVYNAGGTTVSTIYANEQGDSLANPFVWAGLEDVPTFYAAVGDYYAVIDGTALPTNQKYEVGEGVGDAGDLLLADGTAAAPSLAFAADNDSGLFRISANALGVSLGGTTTHEFSTTGIGIDSNSGFLSFGSAYDVVLAREAANVLALKNGTAAQTVRVYGDATKYAAVAHDGTNGVVTASSGALQLAPATSIVQFGGATASFPALKRSTTTLQARLADDSAYTQFNAGTLAAIGASGQVTGVQQATALSSALSSGSTYTFTNLIPAGSIVLGVTCRVTTLITGATSISIGDGTDADRWGAGIAVAANTTTSLADATITSVPIYAAATSVVLTAAGSDFTAGVVRATVHYVSLTAATS